MANEELRDIEASLAGDAEAFARIVRRYEAEVVRLMWRFSRDRLVCETLVQDVFVEVYFSLKGYRGRGSTLLKHCGTSKPTTRIVANSLWPLFQCGLHNH